MIRELVGNDKLEIERLIRDTTERLQSVRMNVVAAGLLTVVVSGWTGANAPLEILHQLIDELALACIRMEAEKTVN